MKLYAMDDLLQNEADRSRYRLVNMVANRARRIAVDARKQEVSLTEKPVTMAMDEANEGTLTLEDIMAAAEADAAAAAAAEGTEEEELIADEAEPAEPAAE